jgi:two-component system chemotaxis response regulator CheB
VVVDDSALIRSLLTSIINEAPDMEVVATASDPIVARERIRETNPDMITLDVEMPRMDGLEFLRRLMRCAHAGTDDFLTDPERLGNHPERAGTGRGGFSAQADTGCQQYHAVLRRRYPRQDPHGGGCPSAPSVPVCCARAGTATASPLQLRQNAIIAVGASTGGTDAIKEFLDKLPANCPPVLIVQHMPEGFTLSFAKRLDKLCAMHVKEAEDGEPLLRGTAYIAPGHSHMRLGKGTQGFVICLDQGPPVNRHRPAVDVLFASVASLAAAQTVAVILTGMGKDGAHGMLQLRQGGAITFAQDEASCVVYGMPREAVAQGGVMHVHPLSQLADKVLDVLRLPHEREGA